MTHKPLPTPDVEARSCCRPTGPGESKPQFLRTGRLAPLSAKHTLRTNALCGWRVLRVFNLLWSSAVNNVLPVPQRNICFRLVSRDDDPFFFSDPRKVCSRLNLCESHDLLRGYFMWNGEQSTQGVYNMFVSKH